MPDTNGQYQYRSNKPQSWQFIEDRYITDWGEKRLKMVELVRHIRNSKLADRLFAYTSMDKLVISIYERIDLHKEALHISFDIDSNEWHFTYFAVPFKDPEFVRNYPAEKGIEKFDKFIKMIGW